MDAQIMSQLTQIYITPGCTPIVDQPNFRSRPDASGTADYEILRLVNPQRPNGEDATRLSAPHGSEQLRIHPQLAHSSKNTVSPVNCVATKMCRNKDSVCTARIACIDMGVQLADKSFHCLFGSR